MCSFEINIAHMVSFICLRCLSMVYRSSGLECGGLLVLSVVFLFCLKFNTTCICLLLFGLLACTHPLLSCLCTQNCVYVYIYSCIHVQAWSFFEDVLCLIFVYTYTGFHGCLYGSN